MKDLTNEQCIQAKLEYEGLKEAGMLWEIFPEATGVWSQDRDNWFNEFKKILKLRAKPVDVCFEHMMVKGEKEWFEMDTDFWIDYNHNLKVNDTVCIKCIHGRQLQLDFI